MGAVARESLPRIIEWKRSWAHEKRLCWVPAVIEPWDWIESATRRVNKRPAAAL